ncbi:efflux RND transporter permease subunit [Corallincola luteus]|uniref:Efflux RND transporter permease subunit n=1 Tax=Corallincola luteus TaxID=1775177 RepID=A0ABY2ASG1_9GAMM|nr:efflux RND transporter permease subunit [Corallincola luteus]TCI05503.1 efflux RND transporter permease subunit [Corallincola luteus]
MKLSDVAMFRPVSAIVLSLLFMLFGAVSFNLLAVREMPDIDSPVISIGTAYRGSASSIVESQITNPIEDELSGIDGVDYIWSSSWDGWSGITITFQQGHNMLEALSDVRDAVNRARNSLPDDVDEPVVRKDDGNNAPIMWLNLTGTLQDRVELSDFAERILIERLSLMPGVSAVNSSGMVERVMYIELDPLEMAGRGLTTKEVINALNQENIQLPAGYIRNDSLNMVVRVARQYQQADDFKQIQLLNIDGDSVHLGDIAQIYIGAKKDTTTFKSDGIDSIGLGIVPMSQANPLDVAQTIREQLPHLQRFLPQGASLAVDYDSTIFIRYAINEVYTTLVICAVLVLLVLYLFIGRIGATLIPAITVPVSLISAFTVAYLLGYSINLITLMALVLAIGLVVDDAIVVVENISRHRANGVPALVAAFRGTKELNFAVIATTLVLVMVFLPLMFMEGKMGRLFSEFAVLLSAAVVFSSIVALTLAPVMAGQLLNRPPPPPSFINRFMNSLMNKLQHSYAAVLEQILPFQKSALLVIGIALGLLVYSYQLQQKAYAPKEDRGVVNIYVGGMEATSYDRMLDSMTAIEQRLIPLRDDGPVRSLNYSAPAFGTWADHQGFFILQLKDWSERSESAAEVVEMIREATHDIPDVKVYPYQPGFGGSMGEPVQFVLQGEDYTELLGYAKQLEKLADESGLMHGAQLDYNPTTPELVLQVNRPAARELGVSVDDIASTLEVLLGGRAQTRFEERGDEYDVYLKANEDRFLSAADLAKVYLRSDAGALVTLDTLVSAQETASARGLFHYQRKKSINLKANLTEQATLGEALDFLIEHAEPMLPPGYTFDFAGESKEYYDNQREIALLFGLALLVCYLVLAAQFESFISPAVVMLTVPLGILGGLVGLLLAGESFNIYSQLGLLMLIGMATKNGILIVEFANQLRDKGLDITTATCQAAVNRLRPILMTAMTTLLGALPMLFASGAGSENRFAIGVVIFGGMLLATVITLFIIPCLYHLLGRFSGSPMAREIQIKQLLEEN